MSTLCPDRAVSIGSQNMDLHLLPKLLYPLVYPLCQNAVYSNGAVIVKNNMADFKCFAAGYLYSDHICSPKIFIYCQPNTAEDFCPINYIYK